VEMTSTNGFVSVETDKFEHRRVMPHFINDCCFGEDFAAWLKKQIASRCPIKFNLSEIIQENYGWGFWVSNGPDQFWVAVSYVGNGPQEPPAQWVISAKYDPGLNIAKRIFHKPDKVNLQALRDCVMHAIQSDPTIKMVPMPEY
jgi:hypothetical protein